MKITNTFKNSFSVVKNAVLASAFAFALTGCGDEKSAANDVSSNVVPEVIRIGVCPGPYRDYLQKYLVPVVEKKGHKLEFVEFIDWLQPDSALDAGDIEANLFQHQDYLNGVVANQGLHLTGVISAPTLGGYIFSDKYSSLDAIPDGSQFGIPNDAVNLARSLRLIRDNGLITLKADKDELKASVADIDSNPKNFEFVPMEAAQLPRSLDSIAVAFVSGNYAYSAGLDFEKALAVEDVKEPIKLVITVQDSKVNTIGEFLKESIQDPDFVNGIDSDPVFKNFAKPNWWPKK